MTHPQKLVKKETMSVPWFFKARYRIGRVFFILKFMIRV